MLSGASSSNKIGCCRKISRDFKHKPRTSCSVIETDLPGRHFFTRISRKRERERQRAKEREREMNFKL